MRMASNKLTLLVKYYGTQSAVSTRCRKKDLN
jgi:hypothetical protein